MRRPIYIAGPYRAEDRAGVLINVARAVTLGRLATRVGFAPIVGDAMGFTGCYGDPFDPGADEPAIQSGESHAYLCGLMDGGFWALLRNDGTMSPGVQREYQAWRRGHGLLVIEPEYDDNERTLTEAGVGELHMKRWDDWALAFKSQGMAAHYVNPRLHIP